MEYSSVDAWSAAFCFDSAADRIILASQPASPRTPRYARADRDQWKPATAFNRYNTRLQQAKQSDLLHRPRIESIIVNIIDMRLLIMQTPKVHWKNGIVEQTARGVAPLVCEQHSFVNSNQVYDHHSLGVCRHSDVLTILTISVS